MTRLFFPGTIRIYLIPELNHSEVTRRKATFLQRFGSDAWAAIALAVLGAAMVASNPWFTPVDDEIAIIDAAARPAFTTIKLFFSGGGQHEHPPLSDVILHGWLWLTAGNIHLIRLPSVIFYLLGAWFLVQAARRMGGDRAGTYTLILLVLWPYGFHLGRLAGWYSFTFLLVSLLTFVYLKYVEHPSPRNWMPLVLCALALVYTNYFGWAVLGFLGLDLLLRFGRERRTWLLFLATGLFLIGASIPIMRAFVTELHVGTVTGRASSPAATGVYNLYCLFVSESVAPWFWVPGIAAGLAIACVLLLVLVCAKPEARRFFLYFAALLTVMTFLQIVTTRRSLMISPWLILPIGTTLATMTVPSARRWLAGSLIVVGAIGWFGIFSREFYAAPHWTEPWDEVAREAAEVAGNGGIVIGNNPSFFFYLTYFTPSTNPTTKGYFAGILPSSVKAPNIYSPQEWIDAGAPTRSVVAVFDGLSFGVPGPSMEEIRASLSSRCKAAGEQDLVRDAGAKWKQEYQPTTGQRVWRIRVVTYTCAAQ